MKFAERFSKEISKLWEDEGLKTDVSIEEWKKIRFKKFPEKIINVRTKWEI